ncbi:Holliday junction ATP-dependent DNA helicase RuvB [Mycoplasmopsis agalactiae]|uniref:ATPase, AAA family n=1 Tax=Mycoplasmopsis agalactiae (strain NCTC 10123 / CIP 59.7 / PG2) TaxID=347257 RepID=A5IXK5_MYCAP|nr:replication-associated recombination protein A [Mycoplasmopsis agalactiae]MCE6056867.1 replication-associated recombination protein A [Mycoplasmopsis agalactiae]MCE6078657.1 replication-associated recombination protein A [Mycoplasmopsis agalactiae]MCE6095041.1 replication-associated recombination protein A [Mycoplasmopsis agalactiae]MCE6114301.1 replication-associated recombination protein A [Mycoplasmopsis agalactiae]QYR08344.1 replication-associated recombination protein A [Mycoplasmopsis
MKNLANELRPKTLDDIIGQKSVVELLKKVARDKIYSSFIFFGESGTGKTSAAVALANDLGLKYDYFNASVNSKAELIKMLADNDVLIIDEIHRLNKDKQDILLSYLEFDKIIIYATTTENPYFRVNPALRSRMQILQFTKLSEQEMFEGIKHNLKKYFPDYQMDESTIKVFVKLSNGDYRSCLNNLQILTLMSKNKQISLDDIKKFVPNISFYSDENSSAHYNNLSAFHKSLRGSDVDAALYYGAIIVKSGDLQGLFRRLIACSYEDVGLADPNLQIRVKNAIDCAELLGLPEARLPIFYAIISVALASKSNSVYEAISNVEGYINQGNIYDVPKFLRDGHYASAVKLGDSIGYKYPHDFPNHIVKQEYLPKEAKGNQFFFPKETDSKKITEYYKFIKQLQGEK